MGAMDELKKYLKGQRGRLKMLAEDLDVKPSTVLTWKAVPPKYCLRIEELTGVSRHDLNRDIYGAKP